MTLCLLGACVPGAEAKPQSKHVHLLALKGCSSVLTAADFKDDLEEDAAPRILAAGGVRAESSSCTYAGLHAEGADGSALGLHEGKLGGECVANIVKSYEAGITPPEGGCYRISHATLVIATGHKIEKNAHKLTKGYAATTWPAGFTRQVLHGVGNRAEFGFSGTKGWGYLQVLNAQLTIETRELGMIELLRDAAAKL